MSTITHKLTIYPNTSPVKDNNYSTIGGVSWSNTPWYPTTIYDPKISIKLGNLNDIFEFKIDNINNRSINLFNLQDKIVFNQLINGESVTGSNQLMTGLVKSVHERLDERGPYLVIKGVSFDEMITNGLEFADLQNVTIFQFLNYCLNSLKNRNPSFPLEWDSGNPLLYKYNPTTGNYDGAALPKVFGGGRISYYNKSMDQLLNYFLNDAYTGDGRYYWYVSPDAKLVIRRMLYSAKSTIIEGVTPILSMNCSVNTNEIFNACVVQSGFDPAGNAISSYHDNPISIAQYGIRPYLLKTNDANTLAQQERLANPGSFNNTSTYPTAYPYTCSWKDTNGNTVTASSNSDYVSKFRTQVKDVIAKFSADNFIAAHSRGMKEITIELLPTNAYRLGDIVSLTLPSYNLTNFPIRIYQIDYSYDNTVLTLKEEVLYAI